MRYIEISFIIFNICHTPVYTLSMESVRARLIMLGVMTNYGLVMTMFYFSHDW